VSDSQKYGRKYGSQKTEQLQHKKILITVEAEILLTMKAVVTKLTVQ